MKYNSYIGIRCCYWKGNVERKGKIITILEVVGRIKENADVLKQIRVIKLDVTEGVIKIWSILRVFKRKRISW